MNSQTLKEHGFTELSPLKELCVMNLPSKTNNVFVLIDKSLSGQTQSDILYIGRTKKPAKKVFGGYISGSLNGKEISKIHAALFSDGYIETACISWLPSDNPKTTQKELLSNYKKEHGTYPIWNNPNKKAPQKTAKTTKPKTPHKTKAPAKPKPAEKPKAESQPATPKTAPARRPRKTTASSAASRTAKTQSGTQ
ncbi:MAG: hypothetical protein NWF04_04130 [Candidatus Bathyarchaeota archaeon]|nr:hypothetical protein [Candidatus Bathyarchaeota archaeon]